MKLYMRIASYYRPFIWAICGALLILFASIGVNLLKPWPIKWLVDGVLAHPQNEYVLPWLNIRVPDATYILLIVSSGIVIHLAWGVLHLSSTYWLIRIGLAAMTRLRMSLYGKLQELSFRFHDERRSADSMYRVAYDAQSIQTFFNRGFVGITTSILTLLTTWAMMYRISPKLSWISVLVLPALFASIYLFASKIRRQTHVLQREESDVLSRVSEGLANLRVVHAFTRETYEVNQFNLEARQSMFANLELQKVSIWSTFAVGLVMAIGSACLLYLGSYEVKEARVTIGELLVFIAYLAAVYQPLEQLSYTAWALEGAAANMERCFEILDAPNDVVDKPGAMCLKECKGLIELKNVHFSYPKSPPVLRGIDLKIEPGQTVAIVGSTGCGKSTLLALIPRFYDPTEGSVCVDGYDLRELTKKSLREQIAIVLQDTFLLNTTILENILYGNPSASFIEVQKAARAAQIEEFIASLPRGYQTEVGERGVRLSGGQKQRIGIARAFLKKSPILLLDEPTSALDTQTEREILGALHTLMQNRTTLIVTHRLTTIHHVDSICVLENGRIIEQGRGEELLIRKGSYWKLFNQPSQS